MRIYIKNNNLGKTGDRVYGNFPGICQGLFMGLVLLLCSPLWAASNTGMRESSIKVRLQELVTELRLPGVSEKMKVEAVNAFFNHIPRKHDTRVWGRKDYWATPDELLQRRQGDCEDVAIAKYFTLRKLGVTDTHLRLAYGKIADLQRGIIEPHMVLIYMPDNARPLVLDSLNRNLRKVSERQDLVLEYTFNLESLWRWQADSPVLLGKAETLEPWRKLLERL